MDWLKSLLAVCLLLTPRVDAFAAGGGEAIPLSREGDAVVSLETTSPRDALERIKSGALVVDVRTPEEFAAGHLENAINVPHTKIAENLAVFGDDRGREIVLYCRSGRRSGLAVAELKALGFTKVINGGAYKDIVGAR
jgi:phage shock protein E